MKTFFILLLLAVAVSAQTCRTYKSCSSCTSSLSNCVWCYGHNATSSSDGSCQTSTSPCPSTQLTATIGQCKSSYCGQYSSCTGCTVLANCAWCSWSNNNPSRGTCQFFSSSCIEGEQIPMDAECPGFSYGWLGMSIAAAIFLVIILPLSVIITIIVCIIVCLRRRRHHHHQLLVSQPVVYGASPAQGYGAVGQYPPAQVAPAYYPQQHHGHH